MTFKTMTAGSAIALCAFAVASAMSGTAQAGDLLYESFADHEIAALTAFSTETFHMGNATNIAVGGGKVFWEDGPKIWQANRDLSGASVVHVNGLAPSDIAYDPLNDLLYESFADHEIAALTAFSTETFHMGNATNIAVGGGKVFWEDGLNIWEANADLSGASIVHVNGLAPSDIAYDPLNDLFYESFADHEIVALTAFSTETFHIGNATNIAVGGGKVFWEDGLNIWQANPDLSGASIVHINGLAPSGLAYAPAVAAGVPEPAIWAMMLIGFGGLGATLRSRRASAAAAAI